MKRLTVKTVRANGRWTVKFSVGVQTFTLDYRVEEKQEADWMVKQLATALARLVSAAMRQERQRKIEEDYGFDELVQIAERLLNLKYPASVFTGVSGDSGAVFVVRLREALAAFRVRGKRKGGRV